MNFISAGRALLLLGRREGAHLWFILTDPDPKTGLIVMVMLVTARAHTDKTVALVVGDHPFIQHDSNIDYSKATFAPAKKLNAAIGSGAARLDDDMEPAILHAVACGLLSSSRTANYLVTHCQPLFGHLCP